MEKHEWLDRYERAFITAGCGECIAGTERAVAEEYFSDFFDGYEDDPEGSADMAMSYYEE